MLLVVVQLEVCAAHQQRDITGYGPAEDDAPHFEPDSVWFGRVELQGAPNTVEIAVGGSKREEIGLEVFGLVDSTPRALVRVTEKGNKKGRSVAYHLQNRVTGPYIFVARMTHRTRGEIINSDN